MVVTNKKLVNSLISTSPKKLENFSTPTKAEFHLSQILPPVDKKTRIANLEEEISLDNRKYDELLRRSRESCLSMDFRTLQDNINEISNEITKKRGKLMALKTSNLT